MATLEQTTPAGGPATPSRLPLQYEVGTGHVTYFYLADVLAQLAADARDRHKPSTGPDPLGTAAQPRSPGTRTT